MFFLKLSWDLSFGPDGQVGCVMFLESIPLSTLWIQESDALVFVICFL